MADANSTSTRICTCCKIELPATAEFFHAYKRAPDGCRAVCRVCRAKDHAANRDSRLAKRKEHYQANRDRLVDVCKAYYNENIEAHRASAASRYHKNREVRLAQMRNYRQDNRDELLQKQRERGKAAFASRYRKDVWFTLRHRVGSLIRVSLRNNRKSKRMSELLGFAMDELRIHIERQFTKGMTWERFMAGDIHIDHIVPIAAFNITSEDCEEFRACWSLGNLRPLWASENCAKKDARITLL